MNGALVRFGTLQKITKVLQILTSGLRGENEDLQLRKEASAMPKDKKKPEKKKEPTPEEESEEDVESVSYLACLCIFFCPPPWPLLVCSPAMAGTSHALCGIPWPQWGFT